MAEQTQPPTQPLIRPPRILGQNQNLVNQIKVQDVGPIIKPSGFYKSIILNSVSILAAFAVGYSYFKFLDGSWAWWTAILAATLFGVISVSQSLLVKSFWHRTGFILVEAVALLVPFYAFDRIMLAAALLSALIFFAGGYLESRRELDHGTSIRFFRVTHGTVAKITTGLLLVALFLGLPSITLKSSFMSESGFGAFFSWVAGAAQSFYPSLSLSGTFGDFTKSIAKGQLESNATFKALPQNAQDAAVVAASAQVSESLAKSLGITLSNTSSTSDVAYQFVVSNLEGWQYRSPILFMVGLGVFLFLVLRSVGVVFIWVTQFLAMILYEIFLASGFLHIAEVVQTKEVIEY